jgi:hypothetical protein
MLMAGSLHDRAVPIFSAHYVVHHRTVRKKEQQMKPAINKLNQSKDIFSKNLLLLKIKKYFFYFFGTILNFYCCKCTGFKKAVRNCEVAGWPMGYILRMYDHSRGMLIHFYHVTHTLHTGFYIYI